MKNRTKNALITAALTLGIVALQAAGGVFLDRTAASGGPNDTAGPDRRDTAGQGPDGSGLARQASVEARP